MLKKLLYKAYRRYSGNRYWFLRRFTPAGAVVLSGVVLTACLGLDTSLAVAYQPFVLLAVLLSFSMLCSFRPNPGMTARRSLPKTASCGVPFTYRVSLTNRSKGTVRGVSVLENLALDLPSREEFLETPEPGEENRNWVDRALGFYRWNWLLSRRAPGKIRERIAPPLPAGAVREVALTLTPLRRGLLRFNRITVARPDPFGLFRSLQEIKAPDKTLVLPKRYMVPPLELAGVMKYQPGGVTMASSVGESEEFVSLREYRPGDPLRHIHWKSWAKTGKPIVKEFQDEYFVRHAMILDTFSPEGENDLFEEAVSVAASFACSIQTSDSLLDLLFVGPEAYCFTSGRGLAGTEKLLEILAEVRACSGKPFFALERLVLERLSRVSGCLCVFLCWDQPRREFVEKIQMRGVVPMVLVLVAENGPKLDPGVMAAHPARFRQIPVRKVQETLLQL